MRMRNRTSVFNEKLLSLVVMRSKIFFAEMFAAKYYLGHSIKAKFFHMSFRRG